MECKGNECITNKGELMEMRKQQVTKKRVADKRAEEDGRKKAKVSKLEEILRKTVPISNEERGEYLSHPLIMYEM